MADRAVVYARTSTRSQSERNTTRYQIEACVAFAQSRGIRVVGEFIDEAVSGTVSMEDRVAGVELLDFARDRKCDVVLVFRYDRVARSSADLIAADRMLRERGVTLISATESSEGNIGVELASYGDLAERELAAISQRMSMGRDRVVRNGRWVGGPVPFGYDLDERGCLVPSQREVAGVPEADLARSVFERMAAGSSTVAEARRLDALGVFPGRHYSRHSAVLRRGRWLPSRINQMIKNPLYVGRHVFNSRHGAIERDVPALVDLIVWSQAQATLATNRGRRSGFAPRAYLLRGLVFCVDCGLAFNGTPAANGTWRDFYYRCNGWVSAVNPVQDERCRAKHIPADWLEALVWQHCVALDGSLTEVSDFEERRAAIKRMVRRICVATSRTGRTKKARITITFNDGTQSVHEWRRRRRRRR